MVFVSHDIAVVASIADRIAVLRNGRLVEVDVTNEVLSRPRDPYTARLIELARRTSTD
jgi:ABC-type dipeptide/oligopeptide/nickel transport system ATPase component